MCVASCRIFTPNLRRKFFLGYRDQLARCSGDDAYVISYKGSKARDDSPSDEDDVCITFESGAYISVHANLVCISKADTSG